jgi:RecJ-like exonuclease
MSELNVLALLSRLDDEQKCPTCGGNGKLPTEGVIHGEYKSCPDCGGTGNKDKEAYLLKKIADLEKQLQAVCGENHSLNDSNGKLLEQIQDLQAVLAAAKQAKPEKEKE